MEDVNLFGVFMLFMMVSIACGAIAAFIQDRQPLKGFYTGFFLGPLGIVIAMLFNFGTCNVCGFRISDTAVVCPGCQNKRMRVWLKDDKVIWPCKHCGSVVNNDKKHAGRSFPCPVCKEQIEVPSQLGEMMTVQRRPDKQTA